MIAVVLLLWALGSTIWAIVDVDCMITSIKGDKIFVHPLALISFFISWMAFFCYIYYRAVRSQAGEAEAGEEVHQH